jgi:hypothetical protein
VASPAATRAIPTLDDIGFARQAEIYDRLGGIVLDSADIRAAPEAMLRGLCACIGLRFDPAMLSWPAGGHPADGVWAAHWYDAVRRSTGFAPPEAGPLPTLAGPHAELAQAAMPYYDALAARALKPDLSLGIPLG